VKLFGTDGLRARAGEFPLDRRSIRTVGRELGRRLAGEGVRMAEESRRVAVLGGDTRESTPWIAAELAAGVEEGGGRVAAAGVITTPGVAEAVLDLRAGAGVSVSASHNPWEDNGIKIFGPDGRKWPDADEAALEAAILAGRDRAGEEGPADSPPLLEPDPTLGARYLRRMARAIPVRLHGLPVLVDAGNGAAFRLGPAALDAAGARVDTICDAPDGRNINEGCGALHPEGMAKAVRERGSAMGVAYDGDADRSIFSDENVRILDGDDVLWIVATDWKRKGILAAGASSGP